VLKGKECSEAVCMPKGIDISHLMGSWNPHLCYFQRYGSSQLNQII